MIEEGGADLIHVDVMDGHFVPNISYGAKVMKDLLGRTKLPFDVHLMIETPDRYLEDFVTDQTAFITVHQEACTHLHRTLARIRELGVKAGVALNPATPIGTLDDILPMADMVLLMSVNPGFGGQAFLEFVLEKARRLREIREQRELGFAIEMDGGVSLNNLDEVLAAGVDIAVAGSAVYGAEDIVQRTRQFRQRIEEAAL